MRRGSRQDRPRASLSFRARFDGLEKLGTTVSQAVHVGVLSLGKGRSLTNTAIIARVIGARSADSVRRRFGLEQFVCSSTTENPLYDTLREATTEGVWKLRVAPEAAAPAAANSPVPEGAGWSSFSLKFEDPEDGEANDPPLSCLFVRAQRPVHRPEGKNSAPHRNKQAAFRDKDSRSSPKTGSRIVTFRVLGEYRSAQEPGPSRQSSPEAQGV
jgi:hypothetical protein